MKTELEKRILSSIILIPIVTLFIIKGSVSFLFFLCFLFIISSYEWIKMNKKKIIIKFLGILFLVFSFYSAYYIRENKGLYFFIFIILICIFTDIGGYVFGKIFKGPKLIKISPNKTYSGLIGGFLFSLVSGIFFLRYTESNFFGDEFLIMIIGIILISLMSQIGDLVISYFKRKANLKNTGKILPGHGGLLDRIDGMVFVIPLLFIFIILIK
tara:strand:- start:274 stop:912 length:639 start_codon:yes stop_codon:yes gene_type:complete